MAAKLEGGFGEAENLLGPYEKWMFDIGKVFDLPGLLLDHEVNLSCVAEFSKKVPLSDFAGVTKTVQTNNNCYWIKLPTLYKSAGFESRFLPFLIDPSFSNLRPGQPPSQMSLLKHSAREVQDFVAEFDTDQQLPAGLDGKFRVNFPIRRKTLSMQPLLDQPPQSSVDPALGGEPPKVILAIIDLGIPFAHANFRHPGTTGTRIDYCWSQSAEVQGQGSGDVLFGREFRRDVIDAWIDAGKSEDDIYREAGLLGQPDGPPMPLDRKHSHGAHVLDLMAGNWPAATAAKARIIAVDLPSSSVWETSGFGKDMFVLAGLHYIFDRADRIKQAYGCPDLPLVINLSYGYSGGPHDGSALIEAAMAELVEHRNREIAATTLVLPSGNMFQDRLFAHLTDVHFTDVPGTAQKSATLQWFAPPCDRTSSFLEFWVPPGTRIEDMGLDVAAPGESGVVTTSDLPKIDWGFAGKLISIDGKVVGHLCVDLHRGLRWRATLVLAPTETFAPADNLNRDGQVYGPAPSGVWTLTLRVPKGLTLPESDEAGKPGGIECRIQRDTSYGQGNTGAKQSYFIDPNYLPYGLDGAPGTEDSLDGSAMVRRFGTLNGMATGPDTLVVGGHVLSSGKAARYSGAGPLVQVSAELGNTTNHAALLDISAPSEVSAVHTGIRAAGTRSGLTVSFRGTSSSAPQVARLLAEAQIAQPLAKGAAHSEVMLKLASQPGVAELSTEQGAEQGSGPDSKARLGKLVFGSSDRDRGGVTGV